MDTIQQDLQVKRLSQNIEYYNNVFKKVEKISSVIFYILSFKKDVSEMSLLKKSLEEKSFQLHEVSLNSLHQTEGQTDELYALRQALVSVMSTLQVAAVAREIPAAMVAAIVEQIDVVQRYLTNHYLEDDSVSLDSMTSMTIDSPAATKPSTTVSHQPKKVPAVPRQKRVTVPSGDISSDAYLVYSQLNDRSQRIKTVLEAKPQATVKDISEIITDVSEKTIQRDLNSLIEKGQVIREGERRWSKYSVVKD